MATIQDINKIVDTLLFYAETQGTGSGNFTLHTSDLFSPELTRRDVWLILKKLKADGYIIGMTPLDGAIGTFGVEIFDTGHNAKIQFLVNTDKLISYRQNLKDNYSAITPKTQLSSGPSTSLDGIVFDQQTGTLIWKNKKHTLSPDSVELGLCRYMFRKPVGQAIDWSEIFESIEGDFPENQNKDRKKIYDAMIRVNKAVWKSFGVDMDLFTSQNKVVRRNY